VPRATSSEEALVPDQRRSRQHPRQPGDDVVDAERYFKGVVQPRKRAASRRTRLCAPPRGGRVGSIIQVGALMLVARLEAIWRASDHHNVYIVETLRRSTSRRILSVRRSSARSCTIFFDALRVTAQLTAPFLPGRPERISTPRPAVPALAVPDPSGAMRSRPYNVRACAVVLFPRIDVAPLARERGRPSPTPRGSSP